MQQMLGAQQAPSGEVMQLIDGLLQQLGARRGAGDIADAERVEHRGDADGRHLQVVRDQRRQSRPAHGRPRFDMDFQVVGVQLDHARNQPIAAEINGAGSHRSARIDRGNQPVANRDRAVDHLVSQDDLGIGEYGLAAHATSGNRFRSNIRVPAARRTSASWKMPTIAPPRARASPINPATMRRLSASSAATGSSSSRIG